MSAADSFSQLDDGAALTDTHAYASLDVRAHGVRAASFDAAAAAAAAAGSPSSPLFGGGDASGATTDSPPLWRRLLHKADPRTWLTLSGWPLLLTYCALTFAMNLPATATGLLLTKNLHFEPAQTNQYYAAVFVPWTIRPVYAFISDQVPILSYRRRPYFIISAIAACAMQVCLALFGREKTSFAALSIAVQVFLAFAEVTCDSLAVEWGNELSERVLQLRDERARGRSSTEERQTVSLARDGSPESSPPSSPLYQTTTDHADGVTLLHLDSSASASPSSSSSRTLPNPSDPEDESDAAPSNSFADKAANRFLDSIEDASTITPLMVKSRIQTECMTIRSTGSVLSAATSIVLLLFLDARMVLLWSSSVFLVGILFMLAYKQEHKVASGYLGLTKVDAMDTVASPLGASSSDATRRANSTVTADGDEEKQTAEQISVEMRPMPPTSPLGSVDQSSSSGVHASLLVHPEGDSGDASMAADDDGLESSSSFLGVSCSLWVFLYRKFIILLRAMRLLSRPLLFIFLFNLMPDSGDSYSNYFYTDYAQFANWQYGLFSFISLSGSLLGCLFYQRFLAPRTNLKLLFLVTSLAASAFGCTEILLATKTNGSIGLNDQAFVVLDSFLVASVRILAQMPPVILASHYAPKGFGLEASMFSLFAAAAHVGSLASAELSAKLTQRLGITQQDWSNLWKLILICNCLALLPLLLMPCLLPEPPTDEDAKATHNTQTQEASEDSQPLREDSQTSPTDTAL